MYVIVYDPGPGEFEPGAQFTQIEFQECLKSKSLNVGTQVKVFGKVKTVEEKKVRLTRDNYTEEMDTELVLV